MRAMNGGEGGVIQLDKIKLEGGKLVWEEAMVTANLSNAHSGQWVSILPHGSSRSSYLDSSGPHRYHFTFRRDHFIDTRRSSYLYRILDSRSETSSGEYSCHTRVSGISSLYIKTDNTAKLDWPSFSLAASTALFSPVWHIGTSLTAIVPLYASS